MYLINFETTNDSFNTKSFVFIEAVGRSKKFYSVRMNVYTDIRLLSFSVLLSDVHLFPALFCFILQT